MAGLGGCPSSPTPSIPWNPSVHVAEEEEEPSVLVSLEHHGTWPLNPDNLLIKAGPQQM